MSRGEIRANQYPPLLPAIVAATKNLIVQQSCDGWNWIRRTWILLSAAYVYIVFLSAFVLAAALCVLSGSHLHHELRHVLPGYALLCRASVRTSHHAVRVVVSPQPRKELDAI